MDSRSGPLPQPRHAVRLSAGMLTLAATGEIMAVEAQKLIVRLHPPLIGRAARGEHRHQHSPLGLRVRVQWRVLELDRQLAEGTQPWRSPELALRAAQLASPRHRAMLADGLDSAIAAARRARPACCVPLCRGAILDGEDDLLQLVSALRSSARCRPHAAALIAFLCCDACSPFSYSEAKATPAQLARAALAGFTQAHAR